MNDYPMQPRLPHATCGAKTRSGKPCQAYAMANGRCRMHGGSSKVGITSGRFEHGRYSKHLPTRLAARYEEAAQDSELLNLRHDIALVESRLVDVLGRVDSGESGRLWRDLHASWNAFKRARALGKTDEMAEALALHEQLISRGVSDYAAWHEVGDLLERKRKLAESERKRLTEMEQMMTAEQAMVLLSAVVDTVRRHVTDRAALAAISEDVRRLVAAGVR